MNEFEKHWRENNVRFDDGHHKHLETYQVGQQSRQAEVDEKDKRIEELERQLKAVHALARMRSAVITADRWFTLRPHIKKAIQCLDRKEKALRGDNA